jgi:hypothetical protein
MARHKYVNGVKVMLTDEENVFRDAEEAANEAKKPMNKWLDDMAGTDGSMPRYMEDLITNNASLVIPTEMKKRYDDKIKVRSERP